MCRCIDRTTPGNGFLWGKLAAAMQKYLGLPCSFYPAVQDARGPLRASRHRQGRRRELFRARGCLSRWARALLVWCSADRARRHQGQCGAQALVYKGAACAMLEPAKYAVLSDDT